MNARNRAWIPVIEAAAEGPVLAAFGALHLSGKDGVLTCCKAEGFTLEQCRSDRPTRFYGHRAPRRRPGLGRSRQHPRRNAHGRSCATRASAAWARSPSRLTQAEPLRSADARRPRRN